MTDKKNVLKPDLWTPRPVEETIAVYAEWAETYDADITARGYHTPERIARALAPLIKPDASILDFGCGTGFSGHVLRQHGFSQIDGTDVTTEMLEIATARGVYDKTWLSVPGELSFGRGAYKAITAVGVVSLGAAPPETLDALVAKLDTGDLLAFSFNDPTLKDASYMDALGRQIGAGLVEVVFREHGRHLEDVDMGSDVIILQRR